MFSVLCSLEYINYVLMCELLYVCVTAPHNVKHWQYAGLKFSVVVFSLSDNQELISNKDELFKFMNLQVFFLRLLIEDVYLGGAAVCIQHCGCLCIMFKVDMYSQRMHRKKSTYVFMHSVYIYMSVFRDVLLAGTALPICSQIHLTQPLFHFYRDSQKPSASVVQNKLSND